MNRFTPKDPGELRHRIALLRRTAAPSGTDDLTETYAALGGAWAKIEPLVGAAYVGGEQTEERITCRVRLRWREDIKPGESAAGLHFDYGGRRFRVRNVVDEGEARTWLTLEAEEIRSGV